MLEVVRGYFKFDAPAMHRGIQVLHTDAVEALRAKGISYSELRPALVPRTDRHEIGLIFDSEKTGSNWYGRDIANWYVPLLDKKSTQSVLCGDLLARDMSLPLQVVDKFLVPARKTIELDRTVLYCVYINNLSKNSMEKLHSSLSKYPAYVGYLPATYQTLAKTYLSTTLTHLFLKHGATIIMGHEDDRPDEENINIVGYRFVEYGYNVRSLRATHFDLFLSFKVERAVYPGFEADTEMALNSISPVAVPLAECSIQLEESKFKYLKEQKDGKLRKGGIAHLSQSELENLIAEKIQKSYIYNMTFLRDHEVAKFNVIVEVPRADGGYPTRFTAALHYKPDQKSLRVITLT